jgi:hypothetical protein
MAPSQSTLCDSGNEKKVNNHIPLPLVPFDRKAPAWDECQEFALKVDPTNPASAEYKFHMHHLKGSEDACGILTWANDIRRVLHSLDVTLPIPAYTLYTQCMRGTALSTFEARWQLRSACTQLSTPPTVPLQAEHDCSEQQA